MVFNPLKSVPGISIPDIILGAAFSGGHHELLIEGFGAEGAYKLIRDLHSKYQICGCKPSKDKKCEKKPGTMVSRDSDKVKDLLRTSLNWVAIQKEESFHVEDEDIDAVVELGAACAKEWTKSEEYFYDMLTPISESLEGSEFVSRLYKAIFKHATDREFDISDFLIKFGHEVMKKGPIVSREHWKQQEWMVSIIGIGRWTAFFLILLLLLLCISVY